ncbi:MAG: 50S ribosomal protein L24 [Candidatus Woesearchaeota archaeon]
MIKKLKKGSKKPSKQRKSLYTISLHTKGKLMNVHLSQELRKKYSIRSLRVKKGDKVKIVTGQHKGKSGRVENVSLDRYKVSVNGIETIKKDGTKTYYKFHPSNLMITELELSDRRRLKRLKTSDKKEIKEKVEKEVKQEKKSETKEKPKVDENKDVQNKVETKEKKDPKINTNEAKK